MMGERGRLSCRLRALVLLGALTAVPGTAELPALAEVATASGLDFVHFNGMSGELYFPEMNGAGVALFDYDGDGDLDVYAVQGTMLGDLDPSEAVLPPRYPAPFSDRLYRNDSFSAEGGTELHFVDVTDRSGMPVGDYGMGVAVGDMDDDGAPDVYLSSFGPNRLLRNRGDGSFEDVTAGSGTDDPRWSVTASFLDYDGDGRLDLYVANYVDFRLATHKECASTSGARDYCGPHAYRPEGNRLLRNLGGGRFQDVSAASGIAAADGATLGVATADFDGNSWMDIYVANDGSDNQLWLNQGDGTFVNDALLAGCAVNEAGLPEASMGVVAADLDGDGSEDLFMAHLEEETNTLYLNDGSGLFEDVTRASRLAAASRSFTGFGSLALDVDLDGDLDLFIANGAVKRVEEQLLAGEPHPLRQRDLLFMNRGDAFFEDVSAALPPIAEVGRGAARGDVDNDGDEDWLVASNGGPLRLYRNDVDGSARGWLEVGLLGGDGARASGSRVAVTVADRRIVRRVLTDGSYASASDPRLVFGFGGRGDGVATVRVEAPRGERREWRNVPLNRRLTVAAGGERTP